MVNIQYGHIGVRSNEEEDDLDECMVIGVFEKREEAVVEKEDDIDLTLDLIGDDLIDQRWTKEVVDDAVNVETEKGKQDLDNDWKSSNSTTTTLLKDLFFKQVAEISGLVTREQVKANRNKEAVANLIEKLNRKNEELVQITTELKQTKESLHTTEESMKIKIKSKEEALEALEEVFETKLKSVSSKLSSVQLAFERKSSSLKEKEEELNKTKEALEEAVRKNEEEQVRTKKLLKSNSEYQKLHEERLLKELEKKSAALKNSEKELLTANESLKTASEQLKSSESNLSNTKCLLDEKEAKLKENILMQEEQMKKITVWVRKLTEEKKDLDEEHVKCPEKIKYSEAKISDLEVLVERHSKEIDTLTKELVEKRDKVEEQRAVISEHKNKVRQIKTKQEKVVKELEAKQNDKVQELEATHDKERDRWVRKNKELTKVLSPQLRRAEEERSSTSSSSCSCLNQLKRAAKSEDGGASSDPEATSSNSQVPKITKAILLEKEKEKLEEELKAEETRLLKEALNKEIDEKEKLLRERETDEKLQMIEKLTEKISHLEDYKKGNPKERLEKLEVEVRDYARANKALQENLRKKREQIAEMETNFAGVSNKKLEMGDSFAANKRQAPPSSWEPPSKRHTSSDPSRPHYSEPSPPRSWPSENHFTILPPKAPRDPRIRLRPIVIDGSNVAMLHGLNKVFSTKGVQIVVDYFRQRGHTDIVAFVPEFRKRARLLSQPAIFERLESEGVLVYTPSRQVDGRRITPYDDNYILDRAAKTGGIVVTRDNFRDLKAEAQCNLERQEVIKKRILMPTFVKDDLMFSDDPMGRDGPSLERLLRF